LSLNSTLRDVIQKLVLGEGSIPLAQTCTYLPLKTNDANGRTNLPSFIAKLV